MCNTSITGVPSSQGSAVLLDFHEIWIRFPSWRDITIFVCMTNVIFDKYRLSFTNNRCLNSEIPPYIFEIEDLEKNPLPRNLREQNLGGRFIDGVAVLVIRAPVAKPGKDRDLKEEEYHQ